MHVAEIMTKQVVTVRPSATVKEIAGLLAEHDISAVPVVDSHGAVVGMVSEGDLVHGQHVARDERSSWWLEMLSEGEKMSPEYEAYVRSGDKHARDVMSSPVVSVASTASTAEVAALLEKHRIKRVPVVDDGHLVGIVSRGNLIRSLAMSRR